MPYLRCDCPKCDGGWLPGYRPLIWRLCDFIVNKIRCNMGIVMVKVTTEGTDRLIGDICQSKP